MVVLPDPPDRLPAAPRTFYDGVRAAVTGGQPSLIDPDLMEIDFGDAGVGVTFPHRHQPDLVLGAQCSRRAAVVFAGPLTRHFSDADGADWTAPAVDLIARVLRGEVAVEVTLRGHTVVRVGDERRWSPGALAFWRPTRTEELRPDFGAR